MREKIQTLVGQICKELECDVVIYSGPINARGANSLHSQIRECKRSKNVLLIVETSGGDAHAAYSLARCLQRSYELFYAYVHSWCKSAGTLLAIGADELVIANEGELGPLDVQVQRREELFEVSSGLETLDAIDFLYGKAMLAFRSHLVDLKLGGQISTKLAAEMAASVTTGVFSPIFGQIDPVRVGELSRAMDVATEYGRRLARRNLKTGSLQKLVSDYPSHGFLIDREEAEDLFKHIRQPTESEYELANLMLREDPGDNPYVHLLNPTILNESFNDEPNNENTESGDTGEIGSDNSDGKSGIDQDHGDSSKDEDHNSTVHEGTAGSEDDSNESAPTSDSARPHERIKADLLARRT